LTPFFDRTLESDRNLSQEQKSHSPALLKYRQLSLNNSVSEEEQKLVQKQAKFLKKASIYCLWDKPLQIRKKVQENLE